MKFNGGLLDLSQYYSGSIQFDYTAMYNQKRQQTMFGGLSQIFDMIGGIGSRMAEASAAEDYADKVRAAKQRAYENAMKIADASAESMLKVAQYNKGLLEENAFLMEVNAVNLRTAAEDERNIGMGQVARAQGAAKVGIAQNGLTVGAGTTSDFLNNITDMGQKQVDSQYSGRLNQINDTLNQSTRMKLEGAMAVWSAEEQAKFLKANAQQRLY